MADPASLTAAVVIDYQNIHLTAHGRFCARGTPVHECLVHPLHFANQLLLTRQTNRSLRGLPGATADLRAVHVFRGLPSADRETSLNRRVQAQRSEWTRDRRVEVNYRPLKYHDTGGGNFWVEEKGIDVMVALDLVQLVQTGAYDLVILACHDTDQEPAIEMAVRSAARTGQTRVETGGWDKRKRLRGGATWHTTLDEKAHGRTLDLRDYT